MMPAIKKAFNLMGDDIVALSVKNESLKNQIGQYDEKWHQESKVKLLKEIDDEKRANLIMSRMKKQIEKHWIKLIILIFVQLLLYKWFTYLIINFGKVNSMA